MKDFDFLSYTVELDMPQESQDMVGIKIKMPKACVYENEKGETEYCPICNHDDVPYCQFLDDDEVGIGVDERPCYCPLVEIKEHTPEHTKTHSCDYGKKETHGDVIYRQDAIDVAIEAADDWDGGSSKERERFIREALQELPSAQPDAPDPNVGTMISRQAALDTIRPLQTYKLFEDDDMLLVDKAEVQTELMMLPSAQPEIKNPCSDCQEFDCHGCAYKKDFHGGNNEY